LHANEGKNRFHGAREREEVAFKSPSKALYHDGSLSPGRKKMRIQRARNSHPTRTMKSNAHVSIERRNIQSKHLHSFLSNIYFASSRSLRANLIFSISRPAPKDPQAPARANLPSDEHRGANGRPSRASRKQKLRKSNEDNSQFLKTLADGIV